MSEPIDGPRRISDGWWRIILLVFLVAFLVMIILSAGCITAGKRTVAGIMETPTPTPAPSPTPTPEPTATPEPTPTPKPEYSCLDIGDTYSWTRLNVSNAVNKSINTQDMTVHVTVYRYQLLPGVQWHSNSWGRDFTQYAPKGKRYLFIFAQVYLDGNTTEKDPRYPIGEPWSHFAVQIAGKIYHPVDDTVYVKGVLIRELENVHTLNDEEIVQSFGYRNIQDVRTGIWSVTTPLWLRMGKSNAMDGYLIFMIPDLDYDASDIIVTSAWDTFGSPCWHIA